MNGSIQVKRGVWYMVFYVKDEKGKRHQKWVSTGLPEKGNKKAAREMLTAELERLAQEKLAAEPVHPEPTETKNERLMLFGDYCEKYLAIRKPKLSALVY